MNRGSGKLFLLCLIAFFSSALICQAQWLSRRPLPIGQSRPVDSILVRFRPGKTLKGLREVAFRTARNALPKMALRREIDKLGLMVYRVDDPRQLENALKQLRQIPEVLYAEPSRHLQLLTTPNDPYYNLLDDWLHVLFPPDAWPYQWPLHFVNAAQAWAVWPNTYYTAATKPANAPKCAVIDTGVDTMHPDFINAGGSSTDARDGGQLDLQDSRNMINGGNNPTPDDPRDEYGHGTHVIGIIGAATNNNQGIAALGYPAQIMVLKVTDASGDGNDADVIDSLIWAADHGALVVNVSLAINGGYSQALQDAINYCWEHNTLVVAAAGNDGVDYVRRYPAACNKVLAVAATTYAGMDTVPSEETNTSYSNQGLYIGIAAPGGDATFWNNPELGLVPELYTLVWSTTPTYNTTLTLNGYTEYTYGYLNGTSMASPHVAALAILYAGYKGFTQQTAGALRQIVRAIQRGADNIGGRFDGGWTMSVGHGRINALATLQETFGMGRDDNTPGCITGQVTYGGTVVSGAAITATHNGTGHQYGASSKEDGTYRIANVPAGTYTVNALYQSIQKSIANVLVEAGCDALATDFEMSESSGVVVSITPHTATVPLSGQQQFTATVTGTGNTQVSWSIVSGPGTIDATGLYYAPTSSTLPQTAQIKATSNADPYRYDIAEITLAPRLESLTLNPSSLKGGSDSTGTITLDGPAPSGDAMITLVSDNAAATVPGSVTVPAGATSATFTVTTLPAASTTPATITATYLGMTKQATLTILPTPPTLTNPTLSPTTGNKNTNFNFSVIYTQAANATPQYAYLVLLYPNGTKSWRVMTTSDNTYIDGSLYTYTTKLPPGSYSYYFQFKGVDIVIKTPTYVGPLVYSMPMLSNPLLAPAAGAAGTTFTFSVVYTQGENVAPDDAYLVIVQSDGSKLWKKMTTSDTTYSDGSLYTYTTKLTNGSYAYYFQFKAVGMVVKTATYTGPVVYSAPTLTDPALSPATGNPGTDFTYSVVYTQGENVAPDYAYLVIVKPDGSKLWKKMTTSDTTCSDGSLYTYTTRLPLGSYAYYFQFKGAGVVLKTSTLSGPTVN